MKIYIQILAFLFMFSVAANAANFADGSVISAKIADKNLKFVVANSPDAKAKGLSGRITVPQNGMIFFFDYSQQLVFWMKDMLIPIDIVWINQNKIIGFQENVPHEPGVIDFSLKRYYSPKKADMVVELNAGDVKKFNIKVGDTIKLIP